MDETDEEPLGNGEKGERGGEGVALLMVVKDKEKSSQPCQTDVIKQVAASSHAPSADKPPRTVTQTHASLTNAAPNLSSSSGWKTIRPVTRMLQTA